MNIFVDTVAVVQISEVSCFARTGTSFLKKKKICLNAQIMRSVNEFTITCKEWCDLVTSIYDNKYCNYFNNCKRCFIKVYSRDYQERPLKIEERTIYQ